METDVLDTSDPFSVEGNNLTLDPDSYDTDIYDIPDPGLLKEKNESSFSELVPQLCTKSSWSQNMTPRARARQLWLLLRAGLHDFVEKEKRAELGVACLTHGLEPLRRLEVTAGLCSVAQDPVGRRFVVLDGAGYMHLHREDGWAHEKLLAPIALTGLVAVLGPLGSVGRFVGWGPLGLAILRPDLSLLWLSEPGMGRPPGHEPICCLPVPDLGLLLVAEAGGSLALWKFRAGGRCLVPRGSPLQPPPNSTGVLVRLALGPPAHHQAQRCFAAYGSAVLTFDLHTWAVIDMRRDLHKTTISDLAYFGEVEAMVTASRDSTVKVWEADWQIRMVFVGHTGPVTAMAVLPNTSLVLSASQDGTLRTWDLQAAAQVGEVALSCWGQDVRSASVNRLLAPAGPGWPVLSLRVGSVELWWLRELYSPLAQLSAQVLHLQVAPALPLHPPLPARLVCACADGSVYLVSVVTGRTVSALLLEPDDCAAAVAYCLPREQLWLLTRAGHLVCANAARCPMSVLYRVCPAPAPAPRPSCLHLYSHLTDPSGAFSSWETVRQHRGDLCRSDIGSWKDKNRYLPVVGHTDGMLSVLEWCESKSVFHTEAHNPGPVTAIASTWNTIVSSGGDLTVKLWRVFPYAEESLSLLRTFSCCHPAVVLCVLGKRVTVAFEDPDSATYGLVQFGLGNSGRCDHGPQDDPTDHITGLCCCPTLKLYASSSLDCTVRIWTVKNRLLRLLKLNGAPQALTFCSNSGDLVLALGSRLCLVSHRLYLPTSYLVKKLCGKVPERMDDPPLLLTSQESLTSAHLQRLASLHGVASLSADLSFIHLQKAAPQQPLLEEDLEALATRDQDLQQLSLGLVVPAAQPPPSRQQSQEAFHNYLRLIYGPGLLGMHSGTKLQRQSTVTFTVERDTWTVCALPRAAPSLRKAGVCTEAPTAPTALPTQDRRTLGQRIAHPPRVTLPFPPTHRGVHSRVSQISMLLKQRPKEPLSTLGGFFPDTIQSYKYSLRPIHFLGWIPNSVVLQQMWLPSEVRGCGALSQLTSEGTLKPGRSQNDLWRQQRWGRRWGRRRRTTWPQKLIQWLGEEEEEEEEEKEEEEEEEEEEEGQGEDESENEDEEEEEEEDEDEDKDEDEDEDELDLGWASDSLSPQTQLSDELLEFEEPAAQSFQSWTRRRSSDDDTRTETYFRRRLYRHKRSRYAHRAKFLRFLVIQNWFKRLFPNFTLKAYPGVGTVEGLASLLMDRLEKASWADRVHILHELLRLLPDVSKHLCGRLHCILLHLLNLYQPPSLQDKTQKQFVMLALQLLLACSLESREVVLELMSYFLYSPAACRPELKKLLDGLGLQDPEGFLFKEMMTWVGGQDLDSKAALRNCCSQKLEEMIQPLQMETLQPSVAKLSDMLPKVSKTSVLTPPPKEALSQISVVSGAPAYTSETLSSISWTPSLAVSPGESGLATLEPKAQRLLSEMHLQRTRRPLSETLLPFSALPEPRLRSSAPAALPDETLPLEQTQWSQSKMLDLGPIDALNFFCELQRVRQRVTLREEPESPSLSPCSPRSTPTPRARQPQPWDRLHPIVRHPKTKIQRTPMSLRGQMMSQLWEGRTLSGSIRMLKLPLPRVDLQPFPPDWPRPARPLPPLLLQPALQRYFLPDHADPHNYS